MRKVNTKGGKEEEKGSGNNNERYVHHRATWRKAKTHLSSVHVHEKVWFWWDKVESCLVVKKVFLKIVNDTVTSNSSNSSLSDGVMLFYQVVQSKFLHAFNVF